jgi:hypothetical protein
VDIGEGQRARAVLTRVVVGPEEGGGRLSMASTSGAERRLTSAHSGAAVGGDWRKGTLQRLDEAKPVASGKQGVAVAIRSWGGAKGSEEQRRDGERGDGKENCEAWWGLAFDGVRCRG